MNKTTEVFESENSNYSSTSVERALKLAEEALYAELESDTCEEFAEAAEKCHEALAAIREVLAEQEKQEPIGWTHAANLVDDGYGHIFSVYSSEPAYDDWVPVYAAPVSAEAIRAEALEEAAKMCDQGTGDAVQTDVLKALWKERERIAEVIRGLK